jgi:aldehyde:ferredoxin oxidoreductase
MYGYTGKILKVDLSKREINILNLPDEVYKNFIGGTGIAAKILFDEKIWEIEPLSPNAPLIFITGPLTGTTIPGSSRFEVCGRSPLTNIWGEASCGGGFGAELKLAGYDGIEIIGEAENPVYLYIKEDIIEIRDADFLWGKDTYETEEILKEKCNDKKIQVACIGIGGENKVLFASIVNDRGDVAARSGLGCVMGSKKLKAIVVRGTKKVKIKNEEEYKEVRRKMIEKLKEDSLTRALHQYGTNSGMTLGMQVGDVPTKNWRVAIWEEGSEKIDGIAFTEKLLIKTKACPFCPIACKRVVKVDTPPYSVKEGPGPEYESAASLGTLLYNDNIYALTKANELCNRYGIDTISCGSAIAFAMECYERGILTEKDTDGLKLEWGNPDVILKMIEKIAKREGIGNILADGVRRASRVVGRGSEKFAIEIKGQEVPMHDVRAYHGLSLTYALSNRGACHTHDITLMVEMGNSKYPEVGIKNYPPLSSENKPENAIKAQNFGMVYSSAVMCYFPVSILSVEDICNALNAVCGWNFTLEDLMKTGERIWYLKRGINNLCGVRKKDDDLPERLKNPYLEGTLPGLEKIVNLMMKMKPPKSPKIRKRVNDFIYNVLFPNMHKTVKILNSLSFFGKRKMKRNPYLVVPEFEKMLSKYYKLRRLNENGIPEEKKLEELGLYELKEKLKNL